MEFECFLSMNFSYRLMPDQVSYNTTYFKVNFKQENSNPVNSCIQMY